jgi:hypothetical protein
MTQIYLRDVQGEKLYLNIECTETCIDASVHMRNKTPVVLIVASRITDWKYFHNEYPVTQNMHYKCGFIHRFVYFPKNDDAPKLSADVLLELKGIATDAMHQFLLWFHNAFADTRMMMLEASGTVLFIAQSLQLRRLLREKGFSKKDAVQHANRCETLLLVRYYKTHFNFKPIAEDESCFLMARVQ